MRATEIYLARNRTKRQHKVYLHEATINMLDGFCDGSVSENVNAIVCAFLQRIGKHTEYIDSATHCQIDKIHRAIAYKK